MNISELLTQAPLAATKFELANFVIGAMDTPSRIIKQIAVESDVRMNNISTLQRDKKRNDIKRKQLQEAMENANGYNKDLLALDLEEIDDNDKGINNKILRNQYELDTFQEILDKVVAQLGEEEVKRLSTPEGQEEGEAHYWLQRLSKQAATDVFGTGSIQKGNMEAILNLPDDMQILVLKMTEAKSATFSSSIALENSHTLRIQPKTNISDSVDENELNNMLNEIQLLGQNKE